MAAMFGGLGVPRDSLERLRIQYEAVFGSVEWMPGSAGSGLGLFRSGGTLTRSGPEELAAWEGEWTGGAERDGDIECLVGNCAVLREGELRLRSDAAGCFPLYYSTSTEGIVFSSLLRPLARVLGAAPDSVGVSQFVRYAFTYDSRSLFQGIRRLAPGQEIVWRASGDLTYRHVTDCWVGEEAFASPEEAAEALRPLMASALRRRACGRHTLMMSAGWDSRTLLAGLSENADGVELGAYSHGDTGSRELRLAHDLCDVKRIPWQCHEIGPEVWDADSLDRFFERTENLLFPHWALAGERLRDADSVFSGVLGEVMGGHYSTTMMGGAFRRSLELLRGIRPGVGTGAVATIDSVRPLLARPVVEGTWYLDPEPEDELGRLREQFQEDAEEDFNRLVRRGVETGPQLLEAFITEHRGAQYICQQATTQRVGVSVGIPFGDRDVLRLASRVPLPLKIHNLVNRALVRQLAPELQRTPMAATLVPASAPILLQEASRAIRKTYEKSRWIAHIHTRGAAPPPRLGWVDFAFIRGRVLDDVIETLRSPIWNRDRMRTMARRVAANPDGRTLHPIFDQMGKILTVDRMLS